MFLFTQNKSTKGGNGLMHQFKNWFKNNKFLAPFSLLLVLMVIPTAITLGKYAADKQVGSFSLEVLSPATLLPGNSFKVALGADTNQLIFGRTKDYQNEIEGLDGTPVDVDQQGLIQLYKKGTTAYILSNRKIFANPDSSNMFRGNFLETLDCSNFDVSQVTDMSGMFSGNSNPDFTSLDLSSWDVGNVTTMQDMFQGLSLIHI